MRSIMKVLAGATCRDSFGDVLIPYSAREMRLKEASHDLRMAIRCIRELSKTAGFSKAVMDTAWEWQAESHKRWQSLMRWDAYLRSRKRLPSWCKRGV